MLFMCFAIKLGHFIEYQNCFIMFRKHEALHRESDNELILGLVDYLENLLSHLNFLFVNYVTES